MKTLALVSISVLTIGLAAPAAAQSVPPVESAPPTQSASDAESAVQDIVVTAQRREERLQDVPIAVSAVTADTLGKTGVRDTIDLRLAVPALYASNGNGYLFVRLRGVGSLAGGPGLENAIASYVDGVYVGSQGGGIFSFGNIERIEVLKGPQGTLFGRNATGGLIQVITREPSHTTSGDLSVGYANYNSLSTRGYLTGGLSDTVAADFSFYANSQGDGWGKNLFNGHDAFRVYHDYGVRSKIVFEPSSSDKFTLSADYANSKNSMIGAAPLEGTKPRFGGGATFTLSNRYDLNTNHDPLINAEGGGGSLRWERDLGFARFSSTSAYRAYKFRRQFDLDLTPTPFFWFSNMVQKDRQFSQELQLSSNKNSGPLSWVAGAFYYGASGRYDPLVQNFESAAPPPAQGMRSWKSTTDTTSFAGYAQGTYAITSDTKLTLGGRYTTEKRTLDGTQDFTATLTGLTTREAAVSGRSQRFNKFTYRVSLDHHFTKDVLGYASINTGFKSGGFNTTTLVASAFGYNPFAPETLTAYEVGLKTQFLDHRLTFNVAGFLYDYKNIQISTFLNGPIVIINGPSARLKGIDAEFNLRATKAFRINASAQILSGKYNSAFPTCLIGTPLGGVPLTTGNCQGNDLPVTAKLTTTLAPEYRITLAGEGELSLNANWYHSSGWFTDSDNVIRQPAFDEFGASARWTSPNERYNLELWGKNLSNARSFNAQTEIQTGDHYTSYAAPRTYGVRAGIKF